MRIRFLVDQVYETGGPGKGPRFPAGHVLDAGGVQGALGLAQPPTAEWSARFLHRWVQRGVAVEVDGRSPESDLAVVATNPGAPLPEDLDKLTRAELDVLAAARGVDISDAKNKGDVVAALELSVEDRA